MPKKVTTESFIESANYLHNFTYIYSKVKYINAKNKVQITCSIHGDFEQKPNCHLSGKGCPKCNKKKKLVKNSFIEKAKSVHKDIYGYSKIDYINSKIKVQIICKEHGIFEQRPSNHLQGVGCPTCAVDTHERTGWKTSDWKRAGEKSNIFDSFKVYIIKCWNENEEFYKIGKTFTTIKQRFNSQSHMPYDYEVIRIFKGNAEDMSKLEKRLQRSNKNNKYLPVINFSGIRECFKTIQYVKQ